MGCGGIEWGRGSSGDESLIEGKCGGVLGGVGIGEFVWSGGMIEALGRVWKGIDGCSGCNGCNGYSGCSRYSGCSGCSGCSGRGRYVKEMIMSLGVSRGR